MSMNTEMTKTNNIANHTDRFEDDSVDLKKYFFGILANWYWFLISIFIGLGIAFLVNRYTMPVYKVSGSLMIADESRGGGLTGYENLIPGMEIYRTQKLVLNEIEKLKSFELTKQTLNKLSFDITYMGVGRSGFKEAILYNDCPFIVIPDSARNNIKNYPVYIDILSKTHYMIIVDDKYKIREKIAFGENFKSDHFNFRIILKDSINFSPEDVYSKYYFKFNSSNTLINSYRGRLGIVTNDARRGSVLFISISGNNPHQISDFLNKLMEGYIEKGLQDKNETAKRTVEFIDNQLAILNDSLQDAEEKLQDFRLENKLIDLKSEGYLVSTKYQELQSEKAISELQKNYYNYLKGYITDRNNLNQVVVPSIMDIADPVLSQLLLELNELLADKNELIFTLQPEEPIDPKISLVDSKIETLRKGLLDNINSLLERNKLKIEDINKQLLSAEKELIKFPVTERKYIGIERQYKVNDQIYTYLLQKRAESDIALAANVSDNKILDRARAENAILISPQRKTNIILGFLIGILLPLGLLILLDLLINKITSRSDVERKTSIPIISTIGHSTESSDIPVFERPKSALAESFRGLRTNLQYLLRENDQKIITITSTISGEGKTFCSTNLAAIFAMAGKKTLLLGLDLRKPQIHKIYNLDNEAGISTYLIGKTKIKEIIKNTQIENLSIITAGPIPPNPAELLEGPLLSDLLKYTRENYDIAILDTPPFGMVTDARLVARLSDLTLFILRQNYSTINILDLLEEVYQQKEIGKMGIIMNDIKNRGYYGYGYRYLNYGYSYQYGSYYNYENYFDNKS